MTRVIDLDQLRAEANEEPVEVRVGGKSFTLPAILPVSLALDMEALARTGNESLSMEDAARVFAKLMRALVGDRADEFMDVVGLNELQHIMTTSYRLEMGESSASVDTSRNGGTPPRPTSPATTTAT